MFISELFTPTLAEGLHDTNIFKAVFVVGPPGAGKDTVISALDLTNQLKSIDIDDVIYRLKNIQQQKHRTELTPGYNQQTYDIVNKRQSLWVQNYLGLLLNQTGRNYELIADTNRMLLDAGYSTYMIFINTEEEMAFTRVNDRVNTDLLPGQKNKDIGRTVDEPYFDKTYKAVQQNRVMFSLLFGKNFAYIDNSEELSPADLRAEVAQVRRKVAAFLAAPLSGKALSITSRIAPKRTT